MSRLHAAAQPVRTLEPAEPDLSDLAFVRDLIGDARVVSIGESAHGTREFYQAKHRLLRYLVEELGFEAYVMESGFGEGLAVDAWVQGGPGELRDLSRTKITYGQGGCVEMRALLQWMRDWNRDHLGAVRFYGMDIPGSPLAGVQHCLERLDPAPGDQGLLGAFDLGGPSDMMNRYRELPAEAQAALTLALGDLDKRADDEVTRRCVAAATVLDELLRTGVARPDNPRDHFMNDQVAWVLERHERVVVAAHNGHVQRDLHHGMTMLGQLLHDRLGDRVFVLGTTYGSGLAPRLIPKPGRVFDLEVRMEELDPPPHTLDAHLAAVGLPQFVLDLRQLPARALDGATATLVNHDALPIDPVKAFDALLHVQHVTPADFDSEQDTHGFR